MNSSSFSAFFKGLTSDFTPVIDSRYTRSDYIHIDLSENNADLNRINITSSEEFSAFLNDFLQKEGKQVAYGGYNELRKLYRRSGLFTASEEEDLNRNIHIGTDVWAEEGTDVLAILKGKIHSFNDNAAFGDYGPTIILRHRFDGKLFYSLYGHLSRNSLKGIKEGQKVEKGERIATLGGSSENGDYAPHLHFQLIRDLQGKWGDYPGVANKREIGFYLENCPDPDLLLKIQA